MTDMQDLNAADWVVVVEFSVALLGLLYFVIRYAVSTRGQWARSPEGRHLMTFRASLALFMGMGVVNNLVAEYPGRDATRIIIVGLLAFAVVQGDALMERAQAERKRLLAKLPPRRR